MPDVETTDLIMRTDNPPNAEPPLDRLRQHFLTETNAFFIRCHGPVPMIDPTKFRVSVAGNVAEPLELSMEELHRRFETVELTATLQCAGNRRSDLGKLRSVMGTTWDAGAIGTARWSGVRLRDVLEAAGFDRTASKHVVLEGLDICDTDEGQTPYGASIPIDKAICEEVILATDMNGAPLTPVHGAPLRLIVPGHAGVRSVKWLASIRVDAEPSGNYFHVKDYKLFPPDMTRETVDHSCGMPIYEMPLNSAICTPCADARVVAGPLRVAGYAVAGARAVARVDLSIDGAENWIQAKLEPGDPADRFAWTFWHADIVLPVGHHDLMVRAVDACGQTQPRDPGDVWNFKGYLSTAWHRVRVEAVE